MKRVAISLVGVAALALGVPGVAAAKHHHARHHQRAHRVRTHTLRFGTASTAPTTAGGVATTPSSDAAGTVAAFSSGVLTITLKDGSTVSGQVTGATEIECSSMRGEDSGSDDGSSGDPTSTSMSNDMVSRSSQSGDGGGDQGGDGSGDQRGAPTCGISALVPGAVVQEAEVQISSAGAVFRKVELA